PDRADSRARRFRAAHTGHRRSATGRAAARRRIAAEPRHSPARAPAAAGLRSGAGDAPAPVAGTPARHRISDRILAAEAAAAAGFRGARAASMPAGSEEPRAPLPADHTPAVDARWLATAAGAARVWPGPPTDHSARSALRAPQADHSRPELRRRREKVGPDID